MGLRQLERRDPEITKLAKTQYRNGELDATVIEEGFDEATKILIHGDLQIDFGPIENPDAFKVRVTLLDPETQEELVVIWEGIGFAETFIRFMGFPGIETKVIEE